MNKLYTLIFTALVLWSVPSFGLQKEPGFFGITRACVKAIEGNQSDTAPCYTTLPLFSMTDLAYSPFQTLVKILDSIEGKNDKNEPASSDSTSKKASSQEIPEEKKVLNRLSLFVSVAEDAQNYLVDRSSTPLFLATVEAMNVLYPVVSISEEEAKTEIQASRILAIQQQLLKIKGQQDE